MLYCCFTIAALLLFYCCFIAVLFLECSMRMQGYYTLVRMQNAACVYLEIEQQQQQSAAACSR